MHPRHPWTLHIRLRLGARGGQGLEREGQVREEGSPGPAGPPRRAAPGRPQPHFSASKSLQVLSGFVPFIQISDNDHRSIIEQTGPKQSSASPAVPCEENLPAP